MALSRFVLAALAGVSIAFAVPAPAQDAAPARTIIVMDGSGSMWGQIDGVPKLQIARQTVSDVLADLPQTREIGLIAYGHRSRGDCSDIELVVPPAAGAGPAISKAVGTMRFQGRTPLSQAVRQAAEALRYTENPATVVLVTDGLETCNADPCALGRELEQSGVDFTAHVVGFGLTREEGARVACLARNTGGAYFDASDGEALGEALDRSIRAEAPEQPVPAPVQPQATLRAADSAAITSAVDVSWTGPALDRDYIDVARPDASSGEWLSWAALTEGDSVMLRMPPEPGDYVVRYISPEAPEPIVASRPIKVVEGEFVLDGPVSVQVGEVFSVRWRGPGGEEDYVDVMPAGSDATSNEPTYAWARDGNPATLRAPIEAGDYQLRYVVQGERDRAVGMSVPLTVTESRAEIEAAGEVRPGVQFPVRAVGPQHASHWVDVTPQGFDEFSGEISYFYLATTDAGYTEAELTAPSEPGTYDLRYIIEGTRGERRVIARRTLVVDAAAPEDTSLAPVDAGNASDPGQLPPG